ncbi:MAG: undecaprenyl phosphate translocase family protein [Bacilli bacterium]
MKNLFKGFIIGIGKIIPGVSGAVLAILLGVYDKSINYINNFNKNKKESIKYLLPLGIGIILAIVIFSKIIAFTLNKYYFFTMLFFIGLIIGGIPPIIKKTEKKDNYLIVISFIIFFLISITNIDNTYIIKNNIIDIIIFLISGLLEAIGTVVPGISAAALLMIIGTYNNIISSISNITNISNLISNLKVIIPFTIGLIIGIIITIKIIDYLFKKYNNKVYSFVSGVLLSSITLLIIQTFKNKFNIIELIIGIILLIIGILLSNKMEEK